MSYYFTVVGRICWASGSLRCVERYNDEQSYSGNRKEWFCRRGKPTGPRCEKKNTKQGLPKNKQKIFLGVQKLQANPNAFGIFGFSFLDQNSEKVKGAKVDGVEPTFDAIADGDYPVSRPLYFYVKKAHVDVIPGLRGFLREFTSERAWGEEGYLSDRGLIPMPDEERSEIAASVRDLKPLSMASR